MSLLVHLQDKIRNTGAVISRLEAKLSKSPGSSGLSANILSMQRLHAKLQADFEEAADAVGFDVLHYRLLEANPTAKSLAGAIGTFQEAITLAYDALRHGPKTRRVVSPASRSETELRVAYSYPGSLGVVFTVPNERMLIPDMQSYFDRATETIVNLGKTQGKKEIITDSERVIGRATLGAVYDWAKSNAQSRAGAAIEWRRAGSTRGAALIQPPEFIALTDSLEKISSTSEEALVIFGTLVGADIKSGRFHIVTSEDEDIRGRFSDAISESQVANLPGRYKATLRKTIETTYATDEQKVTYFLDRLEQT